jgi:hypothetical protein
MAKQPAKSPSNVDVIFEQLVQRHGANEISDVAICRSISTLLGAEIVTPQQAQAAAALTALLKPRAEKKSDEPQIELSYYSDRQLAALERLILIGQGKKPSVPEHRKKTRTHWCAIEVAATIDEIAERSVDVSDPYHPKCELSDADLDLLVRALGSLFISALPDVTMLPPYFWKLMLPAIQRYRESQGIGTPRPDLSADGIGIDPNEKAPKPVTDTADNVIPINTPNQFAAIAAANASVSSGRR